MYDQNYGEPIARPRFGNGCKYLLIVTSAAYLLQLIADRVVLDLYAAVMGLSWAGVSHFWLWQFVTYMFAHGSLFHLLVNMMGLYFLGRDIEDMLGTARFLILYFASGILGGLLWLAFSGGNGLCIGASGGVFGLIGAFGAIFARRRITLLIYFILPVTMTGRTLAIGAGLLTLFSMMYEMMGDKSGVAHLAHLGGGIGGYIYGWWIKKTKGFLFGTEWSRWTPLRHGSIRAAFRRRNIRLMDPEPDYRPQQSEVDSILDKVSTNGMDSITQWDRQILDRASRNGVR